MVYRLIALAVLLGVSALFYWWWQGRQGVVRRVEVPGALTSTVLGDKRGLHATFVQFSTPMCAKCPPTAVLLKRVASEQPHVAHIEIDAAERVVAVYGPFYARLAELFARYSPDELGLLVDWFERAGELTRGYLDESR